MEKLFQIAVRLQANFSAVPVSVSAAAKAVSGMRARVATLEAGLSRLASQSANDAKTLEALYARYANAPIGSPGAALLQNQQARLASSQAAHTRLAEKAAAFIERYPKAASGAGLMAVGAAMTGIAAVGATLLTKAIGQAAKMEMAITNLGIASTGSKAQLAAIEETALVTSGKTQYAASQIVDMARLAASNGLNSRSVLNKVLPLLARASEVALVTRGTSYKESIPAFVQMAHILGTQGTPQTGGVKAFRQMLDLAARALPLSGATPDQLVNMLSYLKPSITTLGLSARDSITFVASAMRMGLGHGRGGASLAAMMRAIGPKGAALYDRVTHHDQALGAMQRAGGGRFFTDGRFNGMSTLMAIIARAMANTPDQQKRLAMLTAVFGSAGSRVAAALSGPGAQSQWRGVEAALGPDGIMHTGAMQSSIASTTASQWQIAKTDMANLAILIGYQLLPTANSLLHVLTAVLAAVMALALQHRQLVKILVILGAIATAMALLIGPVMMVAGGIATMGGMAAIGPLLAGFLLPLLGVLWPIVAAAAVAAVLLTQWGRITKAAAAVWHELVSIATLAGDILNQAVRNPLVQVTAAFTPLRIAITLMVLAFRMARAMISAVIKLVEDHAKQAGGVAPWLLDPTGSAVRWAAGSVAPHAGDAAKAALDFAGVGADNPDNPSYHKPRVAPRPRTGGGGRVVVGGRHEIHLNAADYADAEELGKAAARHVEECRKKDLQRLRGHLRLVG